MKRNDGKIGKYLTALANPFLKSSALYIAANILGQGATFLGIIVFSRIMTREDYGAYSTYYATVSILVVLVGACLYIAVNNAYIDYADTIGAFRKSALFLSTLTASGVSAILLTCCALFSLAPVFVVSAALVHAYSFFVVNFQIYSANMENNYRRKTVLLILPNSLQFLLSLLFISLFSENAYLARVCGSSLGVFSCAAVCYLKIMRHEGRLVRPDYWKYALSISLPSIVMSLSFMIMQQCDRLMITAIRGPAETAVYSAIYYVGYAIEAIDQAAAPVREAWIFRALGSGTVSGAAAVQRWYLLGMSFLTTGMFMVAPEAIRFLLPEGYWAYEYVPPFIMGACVMALYRFDMEIAMFYKRNVLLSAATLFSALTNVVLNALFIPAYGAIAAAYTTLAGFGALFFLSGAVAKLDKGGVYDRKLFLVFSLYLCGLWELYRLTYRIIAVRYVGFSALLLLLAGYAFIRRGK